MISEIDIKNYVDKLQKIKLNLKNKRVTYTGKPIDLFADSRNSEIIERHFHHLETSRQPLSSISFVEFKPEIKLPFRLSSTFIKTDNFIIQYLNFFDSLVITETQTNTSFVLYKNTSTFFYSDTLRIVLQLLIKSDAVPIHGGTIGWNSSSALISNVGGSGKSTLIVSAIMNGGETTGDDFGLISFDNNGATTWSQFATFKLSDSSPIRKKIHTQPIYTQELKDVFGFEQVQKDSLVPFHKIDKIIIPILGDKFSIVECSPGYLFERIAPSSAGFALDRQRTTLTLNHLCRTLPGYKVTLSPDLDKNIESIRNGLFI